MYIGARGAKHVQAQGVGSSTGSRGKTMANRELSRSFEEEHHANNLLIHEWIRSVSCDCAAEQRIPERSANFRPTRVKEST